MPPKPGSSNESSMGSNSSIKSSWQLTTVPLGACRSHVSQKPDHPWPCLCPVLFHQADGRDPAEAQHSREAPLCPPLSAAAAGGTQLTKAQPVFTNKILPTSIGHTPAARKWFSGKSLLPQYHGDLQAASTHTSTWGKAMHTPMEGRGVTNNSSGKGTPDLLPVCSMGSIHYTALPKAVG